MDKELRLRNIEWGGQRYRRERNRDGYLVFEPVTQSGRNREEWLITTAEDLYNERMRQVVDQGLTGDRFVEAEASARADIEAEERDLFVRPMTDLNEYARQITLHNWNFERDDYAYVEQRLAALYNRLFETAVIETVTDCYPDEAAAIEDMAEVDSGEYRQLYNDLYARAFEEQHFARARGRAVAYTVMFSQLVDSASPDGDMQQFIKQQIALMRIEVSAKAGVTYVMPHEQFMQDVCAPLLQTYPHMPDGMPPAQRSGGESFDQVDQAA